MQGRHVDPLGAVYAEALANVAQAEGGLDLLGEIGGRLEALGTAWAEQRSLRAYFLSAEVPADEKSETLERVAAEQPKVFGNFLRLLFERGRISLLREIDGAYQAIVDDRLGRVPVLVSTATEASPERLEAWREGIRAAAGLEPVVKHTVRPELIAGAVIQVGDIVADGSARRRLAELERDIIVRGKHALQA